MSAPEQKKSALNSIWPVAAMIVLIVVLTKYGVSSGYAIGVPIGLMVIYGIIKQSVDTRNAKTRLHSQIDFQNASRITTTKQLSVVKVDDLELFSNKVDVPAGEHLIKLHHERFVAVAVAAVTQDFDNIKVTTLPGQELQIGWEYADGDPNNIRFEMAYVRMQVS